MILQLFAIDDDKLLNFTFNHADQVDEYGKSVGDFTIVQTKFDSRASELQTKHNSLIDSLKSFVALVAGSFQIGHKSPSITAENVGDALEENRLAIADAILGQIPDNSLTELKMAAEMKKQTGGVLPFDNGGDIATLTTTDKTSLVNAINEVDGLVDDLATNKDTALDGQVLTSNGDGTSTFEDAEPPAWETITKFSTTGGESQIDFESLDLDTYKFIKVLVNAKALVNAGGVAIDIRINDIATSSYRIEEYTFTNAFSRNQSTSATYYRVSGLLATSSNKPSMSEVLFSNNTNEKSIKTTQVAHGSSVSQPSTTYVSGGFADITALITKLSFICQPGTTFLAGSEFVLMGVKA